MVYPWKSTRKFSYNEEFCKIPWNSSHSMLTPSKLRISLWKIPTVITETLVQPYQTLSYLRSIISMISARWRNLGIFGNIRNLWTLAKEFCSQAMNQARDDCFDIYTTDLHMLLEIHFTKHSTIACFLHNFARISPRNCIL